MKIKLASAKRSDENFIKHGISGINVYDENDNIIGEVTSCLNVSFSLNNVEMIIEIKDDKIINLLNNGEAK